MSSGDLPAWISNGWKREKRQPTAVPLDTLPERCTMTMHREISVRGSLMPAADGSAMLSDTLSPTRQWGREKSALDHMRQIPLVGTSVSPYWLKLRFSHVYIWQCSHFVFHVVRFEVWACARAKTMYRILKLGKFEIFSVNVTEILGGYSKFPE